jgi:hypothetical protein
MEKRELKPRVNKPRVNIKILKCDEAMAIKFFFFQMLVIEQKNEDGTWQRTNTRRYRELEISDNKIFNTYI